MPFFHPESCPSFMYPSFPESLVQVYFPGRNAYPLLLLLDLSLFVEFIVYCFFSSDSL